MLSKTPHYICRKCKDQLDVEYGFKDVEVPRRCQVCGKFRYCRLSTFQKVLCVCHCPCRACREVQRKRL